MKHFMKPCRYVEKIVELDQKLSEFVINQAVIYSQQ